MTEDDRTASPRLVGLSIEPDDELPGSLVLKLVEVQAGWRRVGQYELAPSSLTSAGDRIFDFEPVRNAKIEGPLADVIAAVTAVRETFAANRHHDDPAS